MYIICFSDDMVISGPALFCCFLFLFCFANGLILFFVILHCLYMLHHLYPFISLAIGICAGAITVHKCLCVMLRCLWLYQRGLAGAYNRSVFRFLRNFHTDLIFLATVTSVYSNSMSLPAFIVCFP